MASLTKYLKDFPDLSVREADSLLRAIEDQDSARILDRLADLHRNEAIPTEFGAALAFDCAEMVSKPDLRQNAIELYLSSRCAEILELGRTSFRSLNELLDAATACQVPDQCRDLALSMARVLLIDDRWYMSGRPTDKALDWLDGEWLSLLPSKLRGGRRRSIGEVASALRGILQDARQQARAIAEGASRCIRDRRFAQLEGSLSQAGSFLSGVFSLLIRPERRLAEHQLRRWADVRDRIQAQPERSAVVYSSDDARALLRDIEEDLSGALLRGEFVLLDLSIAVHAELRTHTKDEMQRWGAAVPDVRVSAVRSTYPFDESKDQILLEIQNSGIVAIDRALVLVGAEGSGELLPPNFEVRYLDPGDVVRQELEATIPSECRRLEIDWLAELRDEFGVDREVGGTIPIDVERNIDWEEVNSRPNPYPTDPVESADRLYGRDDSLRDLARVVRSGESRYLTGQRRIGKTSVARVLLETIDKEQFIPVYAPWGEIGGKDLAAVCRQLCGRLREEAIRVQPDLEAIGMPPAEEFESSFNQATVGFIRRVRTTSGRNIVMVLDDFDDVPHWVHSGESGELFFSMLKTLTGSRGISLIFVGGQKLRHIMLSPVAGKLNQVTPIDLGYLPYQSMQELVTAPAGDVLRFEDEATDRVTYWSACNPFYANRVCNQLWNYLLENKWSSVVAEDLDRIVHGIASHDDSPLFSHFWLDGVWGDEAKQQSAIESNKVILFALGRLGASDPESRHFHLEEIRRECRYLTDDDLRKWLADLVARGVLERHDDLPDHYAVRVPYFQLWLAQKGVSELYASLDPSVIASDQRPEEEAIADEEIEALVQQGIRYRTGKVGVYEIRRFLRQFGTADNQRLMFQLVERLVKDGFFGQGDVEEAATAALGALSQQALARHPDYVKKLTQSGVWKNVFVVVPSGSSVTSFQALADLIRQKESLSKKQTGTPTELVEFARAQKDHVAVLLFDDVIGTGTTAYAAVEELLTTVAREEVGDKIACVLFYAVTGFRDVLTHLNQGAVGEALFEVYRPLAEANQAFSEDAGIFDSQEKREKAKQIAESYGSRLEPKWPLGYGGRQALVSFYRNTPNITLPIFFKFSRRKGFSWQPLFRRM